MKGEKDEDKIKKEIAKVTVELEKLNRKHDDLTIKKNRLKSKLDDCGDCEDCLARLEELTDSNDFHTNCAKYVCIYCRNHDKPCKYFTPYDKRLKDRLNRVAEELYFKSDRFELICKLSTNEEALDKLLGIFDELNNLEEENEE